MDDGCFRSLVEDIRKNGVLEPIMLWDGKILDGRHRYRACVELGVSAFNTKNYDGRGDPLDYVIAKNLHRRHLDEAQRAMVAGKIANLRLGANQHRGEGRPAGLPSVSNGDAARMMNVGERSVRRARVVLSNAVPELQAAVEMSRVSLSAAEAISYMPAEEQREVVRRGPAAVIQAARESAAERRNGASERPSSERLSSEGGKRQKLTKADVEAVYERVLDGESVASLAKTYGVDTKVISGIIGSRNASNSHMQVPEGATVESQMRRGMDLEADGYSADDAAKEIGIGANTYRRLREMLVLASDEIDLNPDDQDIVIRAIKKTNETKRLDAHDSVLPIIERVWGAGSFYHTPKAARKRLEHFDTVVGNAVNASQILKNLEIPYLTTAKAKSLAKEVRDVMRDLGAFLKRLDKETG